MRGDLIEIHWNVSKCLWIYNHFLWNTIYKNPALGVWLCNSWTVFCRSLRLCFFSCFHAEWWSVDYFLILAIVFFLVLSTRNSFGLDSASSDPTASLGERHVQLCTVPLKAQPWSVLHWHCLQQQRWLKIPVVGPSRCSPTQKQLSLHTYYCCWMRVVVRLFSLGLRCTCSLLLAAPKEGWTLHVPREEFKLFCLFRAGKILEIFSMSCSLVELWDCEKRPSRAQLWAQLDMPVGYAALFEPRQSNIVSALQGSTLKR